MAKNKGIDILIIISIVIVFIIKALTAIAIVIGIIAIFTGVVLLIQFIIESIYFNSKKFLILKNKLRYAIIEYNELNEHIKTLKNALINYSASDYGLSEYTDNSIYNFTRPNFNKIHNNTTNEYYCSLSVCRNAQTQPFKYLCKYFSIPVNEQTLNKFEKVLNDFSAAEEGKRILLAEINDIKTNYKKYIPITIRMFRMGYLLKQLGYTTIQETNTHYPNYSFIYISAGGNSKLTCDITLDIDNLERFTSYLFSRIQLTKSTMYQRTLMTKQLREHIKARDNYTCQNCGISVQDEPHLLLEIDHIIPISKNGKTSIDNLQTLCWKCNRQKSNKLI